MDSLGFLSLSITFFLFFHTAAQVHKSAESSPQTGYRAWEESNEIKKPLSQFLPFSLATQRYRASQSSAPVDPTPPEPRALGGSKGVGRAEYPGLDPRPPEPRAL